MPILLLALLLACSHSRTHVLPLKFNNVHNILASPHSQLILLIYPYSCLEKCSYDIDEFYKIARDFHPHSPHIQFAMIDSYQGSEIAQEHQITEFSTILYYTSLQDTHIYNSTIKITHFSIWFHKLKNTYPIQLTSLGNLTEYTKRAVQLPIVIYYQTEEDDSDYFTFLRTIDQFPDILFAFSTIPEAKEMLSIPEDVKIVLYKDFDQRVTYFNQIIRQDALERFLSVESSPIFQEINGDSLKVIYHQGHASLILFLDSNQQSVETFKLIDVISQQYKYQQGDRFIYNRIKFFYCLHSNHFYSYLRELFGISSQMFPPNIVVTRPRFNYEKFIYQGDLMEESLNNFLQDFLKGNLKPQKKSEARPVIQDEELKIIVGDSFQEEVLQSKESIVVVFYTQQCSKCKDLFQYLALISTKYKGVVFGKVNVALNDIAGLTYERLPSIKVWKKGEKDQAMEYREGRIDQERLDGFLKQALKE